MYLIFDTETIGLPKDWAASVIEVDNWPRVIQLAYLLFDEKANLLHGGEYIIKPDDFFIPKKSYRIHGISLEKANTEGKEIQWVLKKFNRLLTNSEYLVAHNLKFDEKVLGAEFIRYKIPNKLSSIKKICTMEAATAFCNIKGPHGPKWPKLSELYFKLFNEELEETHNAANDVAATAKCFWELKKKGVIRS